MEVVGLLSLFVCIICLLSSLVSVFCLSSPLSSAFFLKSTELGSRLEMESHIMLDSVHVICPFVY